MAKKTPLLLKLRKNSGTIYVFPSASEDVGLNLNSDINGAAITHFALLNIPNFNANDWFINQNNADLNKEFTTPELANFIPTLSLLNYMMNLETVLLNQPNYNFQELSTVTEKCFWHWLMANKTLDVNPSHKKFEKIEYNNKTYYYEPDRINNIVKCFGSIDAGNSINNEFGIFNETYINIPSSYGGGPVFFEQMPYDKNYPNAIIESTSSANTLEGRDNIEQYVSYSGNHDNAWYDVIKESNKPGYDLTGKNTNNIDSLEIVKDIDTINALLNLIVDNKKYEVVSYDDINIDRYKQLKLNQHSLVSTNFEFNAILLYYSIYDANDRIKSVYATNLFGIIFLDGVTLDKLTTNESLPIIKGISKRLTTDSDFGTAYSFRVNVKTLSIYDNTDALILDNNTMASVNAVDFSGVINQLNKAIDIMNTNVEATSHILNTYAKVMSYYDKQGRDIHDISTYITKLKEGKVNSTYTLESLYCNDFYSVSKENQSPDDSSITFYLLQEGRTEYGEKLYISDEEPYALKIDHSGIHTKAISSATAYHQQNYRINIKGVDDYSIWSPTGIISPIDKSSDPDVRLNTARSILDLMFDASSDMLRIKLYHDPVNYIGYNEGEVGDPILNYLYIDEASKIFDAQSNQETLNCLKDKDTGFVDYVGLIPYMVAQLQKVNSDYHYTYNPDNNIFDVTDIKSTKDALDFMLNIFQYDDVKNYIGEIIPTIYTYNKNIKGSNITDSSSKGFYYFYKTLPVLIEYNWTAAEPNHNWLGAVDLTIANTDINENIISDRFKSDNAYNQTLWDNAKLVINKPFTVKQNNKISNKHIVDEYIGTYSITNPLASVETTLTLKSKIKSTLIRTLLDKTITTKVKCLVLCYYWTGLNDTNNYDDVDVYDTSNGITSIKNLQQNIDCINYFDIEDKSGELDETQLYLSYLPITDKNNNITGMNSMYVYFLLPAYDNIVYNIHLYDNIDTGVSEIIKFRQTITLQGIIYNLYRSSKKYTNSIVKIKITK